ncbi:MAG: C4-dicarboxylic acid transporter DauA [Planctomycetia bacterium]|nr:C4-dicarboxylic acid transporter DauA [Planctomycetia bacterium]
MPLVPQNRRSASASGPPSLLTLPAAALRARLREGYGFREFQKDLLAGVVVGIVALPLAMALAIAVGVPPQYGLYTAVVAGFLAALLGGSRTQVTGPTAAFIVILAPIYAKFGMAGLLMSGLLGGVILFIMGIARMGKFIEFVPYPVTTGFTAGIATVIATLQVKDVFGLALPFAPEHYHERLHAYWLARGTVSWWEFGIAAVTLAILVLFPKFVTRRLPAPLVAIPFAAVLAWFLKRHVPGFDVATVGSRFSTVVDGVVVHGIPRLPPMPLWPPLTPGPGGAPLDLSDFTVWRQMLPGAFAVAMLGAIESLLSAVVADGMAQTKHDPDAELLGQGVANIVCPFFGGIPATGAIARTATNIRFGALSPVAAMVHAVTILAAILALAPLVAYLPMAALAGLLLLVAWNMAEVKHFVHIVRTAPRADVAVLLACFSLTVVFDMVVSVTVGFILAAILFMKRMAELTQYGFIQGAEPAQTGVLPPGVLVYSINGPLFFGAAERAMGALGDIADGAKAVVFRLKNVPAIDATGLVAMESALGRLKKRGILAVLAAVPRATAATMLRAGIRREPGKVAYVASVEEGIRIAGDFASGLAPIPRESVDKVAHGQTQILHGRETDIYDDPRR